MKGVVPPLLRTAQRSVSWARPMNRRTRGLPSRMDSNDPLAFPSFPSSPGRRQILISRHGEIIGRNQNNARPTTGSRPAGDRDHRPSHSGNVAPSKGPILADDPCLRLTTLSSTACCQIHSKSYTAVTALSFYVMTASSTRQSPKQRQD